MIYSELAQRVIDRLVSGLRASGNPNEALDQLTKDLSLGLSVERVLVWQISKVGLTVTNEYSTTTPSLVGTTIELIESSQIALNFLSEFTDSATTGVLELNDECLAVDGSWAPFRSSSIGMTSTLVAQLRARGVLTGCLAVQTKEHRKWSEAELTTLEKVSEVLSLLLSYILEIDRLSSIEIVQQH